MQASLYQVKKAEKEKEGFRKKTSWLLRQLKLFDAKYINKVNKTLHMSGTVCSQSKDFFIFYDMALYLSVAYVVSVTSVQLFMY